MSSLGIIRGPFDGPNARALKIWIQANMPELDAELGPLGQAEVRRKLNEVTGLDVRPEDGIEATCPRILAALQAQHASKGAAP